MSKPLSGVKLIFPDQAPVYLIFQEMKLQKKKAKLMSKLIISLLYQRILHSLLLKHK